MKLIRRLGVSSTDKLVSLFIFPSLPLEMTPFKNPARSSRGAL